MRRSGAYLIILFLISAPIIISGDGGTASPFEFGAGAREISLGGSNLTAIDPAAAPYWNPSQLVSVEKLSLTGFQTKLYDSDIGYQYLGFAFPTLDWGTVGIGIFRLGIDNIERRDQSNMLTGYFDDNRFSYYLAYGRKVSEFDIGFSINIENHKLDNYSATSSPGINLSIGRSFSFNNRYLKDFSMTLVGRNLIRPGIELFDSKIKYPYASDFSASFGICPSGNPDHKINLSADISKTDFIDPKFAFGLEYSFQKSLFIRGGVRDGNLSVGGGLKYKMFAFDYALVERDMGSLHLFSITTSFGRSITERRKSREIEREAQFNSSMNRRLSSRYEGMIEGLVTDGRKYMDAENLAEASSCFDKALFLAQSNGLDTTEIARLAGDVHIKIEEENNRKMYRQYIDSAKVKFESKDYLGAKYFANLAGSLDQQGSEAAYYLKESDRELNNMASHEEMIRQKLIAVDSLLGYGYTGKALTLIKSLSQFAATDNRIQLALKKVEFEYWKDNALSAYNARDYAASEKALDTALVLFPGHKWCLEMKQELDKLKSKSAVVSPPAQKKSNVALSGELLREAENNYKEAQRLFEAGDLKKAIELWEKVEKIAPDYQSVRQYLVKAYRFVGIELYGQNKLEESIAVWNKALALDPYNQELIEYIKRTESEIRKLKELSYESK